MRPSRDPCLPWCRGRSGDEQDLACLRWNVSFHAAVPFEARYLLPFVRFIQPWHRVVSEFAGLVWGGDVCYLGSTRPVWKVRNSCLIWWCRLRMTLTGRYSFCFSWGQMYRKLCLHQLKNYSLHQYDGDINNTWVVRLSRKVDVRPPRDRRSPKFEAVLVVCRNVSLRGFKVTAMVVSLSGSVFWSDRGYLI